jgi:phage shock protein A
VDKLIKNPEEISREMIRENHKLLEQIKEKDRQIESLSNIVDFMKMAFKDLQEDRDQLKEELNMFKRFKEEI